jgi:hypothetical protein
MTEYVIRFIIGGIAVSAFTVMGDLFRPKSFAGLIGAAPSIALAALAMAFWNQGPAYAACPCAALAKARCGRCWPDHRRSLSLRAAISLRAAKPTLAVFSKPRRQLKQDRGNFGRQRLEAGFHQRNGAVALLGQPLPMGDEFRRLPRKPEIRGRIVPLSLDRLQGRRPVERAVDLGGGKAHGIKAQPPCAPLAPRVKRPSPAVIGPARSADQGSGFP